jgi:hypothetical protein
MECEEVEAPVVRDDRQRFADAYTALQNNEIKKLEAEEEKRRLLFAQRQKELNDYFAEQKQYKEATDQKLAEQRAKDLKEQQEIKEKLAIAEREKQLAEAESIRANLTVLQTKHDGEQENREQLKKLVHNSFYQERNKFLEEMEKERNDFDQFRKGIQDQIHDIRIKSQAVVDDSYINLMKKTNRTPEEDQLLMDCPTLTRDLEENVMDCPTLTRDETAKVKTKRNRDIQHLVDHFERITQPTEFGHASGSSLTEAGSHDTQHTAAPVQTAPVQKPTQRRTVEKEKQKPPEQCQHSGEDFITPATKRQPQRTPAAKRKTASAARNKSDDDSEDISPDKKKAFKVFYDVLKKTKTTAKAFFNVKEVNTSNIADLVNAAQEKDQFTKLTSVIKPKDNDVYIVKAPEKDINKVRDMDKLKWKHNGRRMCGTVGPRIYYSNLDEEREINKAVRKTIVTLTGKNVHVVHYKIDEVDSEDEPREAAQKSVRHTDVNPPIDKQPEEPITGTLKRIITKTRKAAELVTKKKQVSVTKPVLQVADVDTTPQESTSSTNLSVQVPQVEALEQSVSNLPTQTAAMSESEIEETDVDQLYTDFDFGGTDTDGNVLQEPTKGVAQPKLPKPAADKEFPNVIKNAEPMEWSGRHFKLETAIDALNNATEDDVNIAKNTIIGNPKGGEVYVFDVKDFPLWKEHLQKDNYSWKSYSRADKADNTIKETYCYVKGEGKKQSARFTKRVIHFKEKDRVVIGYTGDHTAGVSQPHGNSKTNTRPHIPVSRVVIESKVKKMMGQKPQQIYNALTSETGDANVQSLTEPRSRDHVKAVRDKLMRPYSFLKDDLTACHRVGEVLPEYVILQNTAHDNACYVLCKKEILMEYRKLIECMPRDKPLIHHLDTTFEYNRKYLSVLSFRHEMLVDHATKTTEPTVPLFSYIHQRKSKFDHELAFFAARQAISKAVPRWAQ